MNGVAGPVVTVPRELPAASGAVPFFSQAASFGAAWPAISRHLDEVVDGNSYSHGEKVRELERALAGWTGARCAVGVNSGTDALVLLLRAAGLDAGDEVVVPAFGPVRCAAAVLLARATPVFADVDPAGWGLDPAAAGAAVSERTRALLPVHPYHRLADLAGLARVAARHGLHLLEDSGSAIGMRRAGRHAGLHGLGGALSFAPARTLGAIGDAGMVLTDDERVAGLVGALRDHGRAAGGTGPSLLPGVNSKMDELQAAVLLAKLDRLEPAIAARNRLAAVYSERLRDVPGVLRVPAPEPGTSVFAAYVLEVERRDELVAHLAARGIGTELPCPRPLHLRPGLAGPGPGCGRFPHAEALARRTLALPLHPDLRADQLERVCDAVGDFYAARVGSRA